MKIPAVIDRCGTPVRATVALVALMACLWASAGAASAQGTGFTGDLYYGNVTYPPGGWDAPNQYHSYGFNSANVGSGLGGYVSATIYNLDNNRYAATAYGHNLARACVHGAYPNCIDTDGWSGYIQIWNESNHSMPILGHGVY